MFLQKFIDNFKKIWENFAKLWKKLIKFCCTTMLNYRPKFIVYVSRIKFLGSCMYWNTRYMIHDVFVYRVPNSEYNPLLLK